MRRGSRARSNPIARVLYEGAGVTLDPGLVGMHFHRWPEGTPLSAAPAYGFGTVRSHDYGPGAPGARWNQIHTAAGTYNWTSLDAWVNAHAAVPGRRLIYTVYGTPAYLRTSNTADAYGAQGGGSPPSDGGVGYPALQAFVTALINRYNDGTPGGRKIWGVEAWNEPSFAQVDGSGSWWGSAPQMVDITRAVYIGRNLSLDGGVRVLSPGFIDGQFADPSGRLNAFLSAESLAASGTYGADWYDETAVHLYGNGTDALWSARTERAVDNALAVFAAYPALTGRPWHVTEIGVAASAPVTTGPWPAMTDAQRAAWTLRHVLYLGVRGAKSVCLYSHDSDLHGDFRKPELAAAIDQLHAMAGQTYTLIALRADGALVVEQ